MDDKYARLALAARAISPVAELALRGVPEDDLGWICIVRVGQITLVESTVGAMDAVLDEVCQKISAISRKIQSALAFSSVG